jgi:hypothetical protein
MHSRVRNNIKTLVAKMAQTRNDYAQQSLKYQRYRGSVNGRDYRNDHEHQSSKYQR